jgi:nucleoid DNA-binding protein
MNKTELIAAVAQDTGVSQEKVKTVLEAITTHTVDALRRGDDVRLVGFGNYSVQQRAARMARNLRTGEPVQIAESKVIKFKPASAVMDRINRR